MPIVGLTTNTNDERSGFPLIARLHKGEKRTEEDIRRKKPGKDLDYFRIEFEPGFENLRSTWIDLYGDKPEGFPAVFVAAPTVDAAFSAWKEEWTAAVMLHRCDGEYQVQRFENDQVLTSKVACASKGEHPCGCKSVGRLALIFPDFIEATGILGFVLASTHSVHDILSIYRVLRDVQKVTGSLNGVEFSFGRAKRRISRPKTDEKGTRVPGRQNVTKSLFTLWPSPRFTRDFMLPAFASRQQLQAPAPMPALTTGTLVLNGNGDARQRLGSGPNPDDRRIGEPSQPSGSNGYAFNIDKVYAPDTPTSELVSDEEDQPSTVVTPPIPDFDLTDKVNAANWYAEWGKQGLFKADLMKALGTLMPGIEGATQWVHGSIKANQVVELWRTINKPTPQPPPPSEPEISEAEIVGDSPEAPDEQPVTNQSSADDLKKKLAAIPADDRFARYTADLKDKNDFSSTRTQAAFVQAMADTYHIRRDLIDRAVGVPFLGKWGGGWDAAVTKVEKSPEHHNTMEPETQPLLAQ